MKYGFLGVKVIECFFKDNGMAPPKDGKLEIKPSISRNIRLAESGENINRLILTLKIASTEAEPKPFELTVALLGVFAAEDIKPEEERKFVIEATNVLFPYFRAQVSAFTASVGVPPLNLPVVSGPLFPEDRDGFAFTTDGNIN